MIDSYCTSSPTWMVLSLLMLTSAMDSKQLSVASAHSCGSGDSLTRVYGLAGISARLGESHTVYGTGLLIRHAHSDSPTGLPRYARSDIVGTAPDTARSP